MKELLFFVLGLVIGGLSGITMMGMFQINKEHQLTKALQNKINNRRDDEKCEKEK